MRTGIKHIWVAAPVIGWLMLIGSSSPSCKKGEAPAPPVDTVVTPPPVTPPVITPASYSTDTVYGNGVDLQPSYYNGGNVTFGYSLMQQYPKIKSVRIEIEPTVDLALVVSWIHQAVSNGYKVIATYHKYTVLGSDLASDLNDAANWWKNSYGTLATGGPITINLMNEWGSHQLSANDYATDYNNAISIVRQVYKGRIILDCPGYGQETAVAAAAVKGTNGVKINDTSVILSVHVYPNGYNQAKNHSLQQADLDDLGSAGRACIIGEFGNAPSGNVDFAGLVNYAKSKHWAVLGWSWNGDGGTMNMITPAWDTTANASSYSAGSYFTTIYSLL